METIYCPKCHEPTAERDEYGHLISLGWNLLYLRLGEAPKIRCGACGMINILLSGSE